MADHEEEAMREWAEFEAKGSALRGIRAKQTARRMLMKMQAEGIPDNTTLRTTISLLAAVSKPGPKPVDQAELKRQVIAARVKMLRLLSGD